MYRRYYLVEVVLLLVLSHGGWNGPSVTLLSCTSESSKLVRDVVEKRFLSVVDRYRVSLPLECPLHPKRDMFWWLRPDIQATRRDDGSTTPWHCPVCGKRFGCENTFVTHWDVAHSRTLLGMAGETVCLNDYCDVFRCDVLKKKMLRTRQEEEEELRKHHHPTSISIFHHREAQEDDEVREKKRNCDPETMSRMHYKCRSLIRQCTLGMVANLSSKDFQDIEDDLDQSICSFLTCDKYWDDFDPHVHRVPVLVFAVFGLLITSLFCFCYYGLWILLEKSPINTSVCCTCQKSALDRYYRIKRLKHRQKHHSAERPTKPKSLDCAPITTAPSKNSNKKDVELLSIEANNKQNTRKYKEHLIEYKSRKISPEYISRQNSPEDISRKNSPDNESRQNSPEYISRQNSPDYNSREYSTQDFSEYNTRSDILNGNLGKHFKEYNSKHSTFDFNSRQYSHKYNLKQNSHEYNSRQNSPEYDSKQNSPEYNSRQNSPEYDSRQNSPEYDSRHNSPEFFSKSNSNEYRHRDKSREHNSREYSPEFEEKLISDYDYRPNSALNQYYHNNSEYKQKSLDMRHRKRPPIASSQSANTLHVPSKVTNRAYK